MKKRRLSGLSSQLSLCFTGDELYQYKYDSLDPRRRDEISKHLNIVKCTNCRRLFDHLEETTGPEIESFDEPQDVLDRLRQLKSAQEPEHPMPDKVEKGQIWSTSPVMRDMNGLELGSVSMAVPVLVVSADNPNFSVRNIIRVIPISFDVDFVFEGESLVLDETSPRPYPILLEIFNETPMLAGNLMEYKGRLTSEDMDKVDTLRRGFLDFEDREHDDEYLAWKKNEFRLTSYLAAPVNESLWAESQEIEIMSYRKAADDKGLDFSKDVNPPHYLAMMDDFEISLVQTRANMILRIVSEYMEPQEILINDISKPIIKDPPDYDVDLGHVEALPESLAIVIIMGGETHRYHVDIVASKGE